jgi:hypothetical protein
MLDARFISLFRFAESGMPDKEIGQFWISAITAKFLAS